LASEYASYDEIECYDGFFHELVTHNVNDEFMYDLMDDLNTDDKEVFIQFLNNHYETDNDIEFFARNLI